VFKKKQRDLEKWVKSERSEIKAKRAKVQDTCADVAGFLQRTQKEKKLMLDQLGGGSTPRKRRSTSRLSES